MRSPRVFLAVDNCFAIKRWVRPRDWMRVAGDLGFRYVEASTDNEIDAIFSDDRYMSDWAAEVRSTSAETGVKIANFYTGYQTYRTIGLAHHEPRMRRRLVDDWLKRMVDFAADLGAGLGIYQFGFSDEVLQDPAKHEKTMRVVLEQIGEVADYGRNRVQFSVEQMYSPHQPPWTIPGTYSFLRSLLNEGQAPVYVTIDLGHQIGQARFRRPTRAVIEKAIDKAVNGKTPSDVWLGPESSYQLLDSVAGRHLSEGDRTALIEEVTAAADDYPYLFAEARDSDPYAWIEELGRYSPIMHLQQTDGVRAGHQAFTPDTNRDGIIKPDAVLAAYAQSFARAEEDGMPPPVEDLYLTFEVFASNTESNREVIAKLEQSHDYWRRYIPEDGLPLAELVAASA